MEIEKALNLEKSLEVDLENLTESLSVSRTEQWMVTLLVWNLVECSENR